MDKSIREFIIESKTHGIHMVLIDEEDWDRVSQHIWHLNKNDRNKHKNVYYVVTGSKNAPKRRTRLHRLIMNCPDNKVIDHINGNTLDNRKINLEIVDRKDNKHNRGKQSNGKNKYMGVAKNSRCSTWQARVGDGHAKHKYLGSFATEEEAATARDREVVRTRRVVRPERQLNFPDRLEEYKNDVEVI